MKKYLLLPVFAFFANFLFSQNYPLKNSIEHITNDLYSYTSNPLLNGKKNLNAPSSIHSSINDYKNSNFALDSSYAYSWDTIDNKWKLFFKRLYTANSQMNIITTINYNNNNNYWNREWKEELSFNERNQVTSRKWFFPDYLSGTDAWKAYRKEEYNYNNNFDLTNYIYSEWIYEEDEWLDYSKHDINYENNSIVEDIWYTWDTVLNNWNPQNKLEYTCNENGKITETMEFTMNSENNEWISNMKTVYNYNQNEQLTEQYLYLFYYNNLKNYMKKIYSYEENQNLTQYFEQLWRDKSNDYNNFFEIDYSFDVNGIQNLWASYNWDENENKFGNFKEESLFDTYFNQLQRIEYNWNYNTNEWRFQHKEDYYWNELKSTDIKNNPTSELINVFPNPSSGQVNIQLKSQNPETTYLEMINMDGKIVYSNQFYFNTTISLGDFSKGIYILKIKGNSFTENRKLIVN